MALAGGLALGCGPLDLEDLINSQPPLTQQMESMIQDINAFRVVPQPPPPANPPANAPPLPDTVFSVTMCEGTTTYWRQDWTVFPGASPWLTPRLARDTVGIQLHGGSLIFTAHTEGVYTHDAILTRNGFNGNFRNRFVVTVIKCELYRVIYVDQTFDMDLPEYVAPRGNYPMVIRQRPSGVLSQRKVPPAGNKHYRYTGNKAGTADVVVRMDRTDAKELRRQGGYADQRNAFTVTIHVLVLDRPADGDGVQDRDPEKEQEGPKDVEVEMKGLDLRGLGGKAPEPRDMTGASKTVVEYPPGTDPATGTKGGDKGGDKDGEEDPYRKKD